MAEQARVIKADPERGQDWLRVHYPKRTMNPKTRDHLAIAVGSAAVLYALRQKKNAQITVAAALGGAVALWMIHRWENAEES